MTRVSRGNIQGKRLHIRRLSSRYEIRRLCSTHGFKLSASQYVLTVIGDLYVPWTSCLFCTNPSCSISFIPFRLLLGFLLSSTVFLLKLYVVSSSTIYPTLLEQSPWSVIRLLTYDTVLSGDVCCSGVTVTICSLPGCQCSKVLHLGDAGSQQLQKLSLHFGASTKKTAYTGLPSCCWSYPAMSRMTYPAVAAEPGQKVAQMIGLRNRRSFHPKCSHGVITTL